MYGRRKYSVGFDKPLDFNEDKHITVKEDNNLLYGDTPGLTFTRVKFNESEKTYEPFNKDYKQFAKTTLSL